MSLSGYRVRTRDTIADFTLCPLRLLRKVFLPNLLDPVDQLPEFIQKDHLIDLFIILGYLRDLHKSPAAPSKAGSKLIASDRLSPGSDRQVHMSGARFIIKPAVEATNAPGLS